MKFIAAACLVAAAFAEPEAKADADAAVLYGAYGAYPYSGIYGGRYLGKRSADAEPEADANAYYGAYGYSAYGASPYAYSAYRGYSGLAGYTGYRAHAGYPYSYGAYPAYGSCSYLG